MTISSNIFYKIFEFSNEGIIITNDVGDIVLINPNALKLFGYKTEELTKQKIEILIPDNIKKHHVGLRQGYTDNPHSRPMGLGKELFARHKSGKLIPVEISLSYFIDEDKTYIMSFIIDITQRLTHERQIKETNQELVTLNRKLKNLNDDLELRVSERTEELEIAIERLAESQKELIHSLEKEKSLNDLKTRFMTTASHEFRTPLATILSSAGLLMKYIEIPNSEANRQKHIQRIKDSVNNLRQILDDFMSLDKIDEGLIKNNPTEFDLIEFIDDFISDISHQLSPNQNFFKKWNFGNLKVWLDKKLLGYILINLITNAIKYSPDGKNITIEILDNDEEIEIRIIDEGYGIPEDEQKFLFERFFRAKNSVNIQGTGLGLSIVKRYLEIMEGTISLKSKLNEGSTFIIKFKKLKE